MLAVSRSPDGFALLALLVSIGLPLVLAVILLFRAEKTALHNDEIIRQIARHGLTNRLIETERLLDHSQTSPRNKILKLVQPKQWQRSGLPDSSDSQDGDSEDEEDA